MLDEGVHRVSDVGIEVAPDQHDGCVQLVVGSDQQRLQGSRGKKG